jgi:hypothetical protein
LAELINSQILENKLADAKTVKPLNNCANNNIHRTTIVNKQKVSLGIHISKDINFKFKIEKKRTVLINIDITVKLTPYWEDDILYLCKAVLTGVGRISVPCVLRHQGNSSPCTTRNIFQSLCHLGIGWALYAKIIQI